MRTEVIISTTKRTILNFLRGGERKEEKKRTPC